MKVPCPLQTLFAVHPNSPCCAQECSPCCALAFAEYLAFRCEDAAALAEDLRSLLTKAGRDGHFDPSSI